MKRVPLAKTAAIAGSLLAAGFIALAACSNQGEGERCEFLNNNDDCQDGLICVQASAIPEPFNNSDRCCPPDRSRATTEACREPRPGALGDSAPPPDTGPPPTPDATVDAPAEAGDASDDAMDASDDG